MKLNKASLSHLRSSAMESNPPARSLTIYHTCTVNQIELHVCDSLSTSGPPESALPRSNAARPTSGSALLADITGFTPLTEGLRNTLDPRMRAEELTRHLNHVYSAMIAEVERIGGSVLSFADDAINPGLTDLKRNLLSEPWPQDLP